MLLYRVLVERQGQEAVVDICGAQNTKRRVLTSLFGFCVCVCVSLIKVSVGGHRRLLPCVSCHFWYRLTSAVNLLTPSYLSLFSSPSLTLHCSLIMTFILSLSLPSLCPTPPLSLTGHLFCSFSAVATVTGLKHQQLGEVGNKRTRNTYFLDWAGHMLLTCSVWLWKMDEVCLQLQPPPELITEPCWKAFQATFWVGPS